MSTPFKGRSKGGVLIFEDSSIVARARLGEQLLAVWRGFQSRRSYHSLLPTSRSSRYFPRSSVRETLKPALASIVRTWRKHRYSDGSEYDGEWRGGFRDGKGEMKWLDGSTFTGKWSWGWPAKLGKFQCYDGEVFEGRWKCPFEEGQTTALSVSSEALRAWRSVQKNGFGKGYAVWLWYRELAQETPLPPPVHPPELALERIEEQLLKIQSMIESIKTWLAQDPARSEFATSGLRVEREIISENGDVYKGELLDEMRDGNGHLITPSFTYTGQWRLDKFHGIGVLITTAPASRYIGTFLNGDKSGIGTMQNSGCEYSGEWRKGVYHGVGKLVRSDQSQYCGEWRDGVLHGVGKEKTQGGFTAFGSWEKGKKHGFVTFIKKGVIVCRRFVDGLEVGD